MAGGDGSQPLDPDDHLDHTNPSDHSHSLRRCGVFRRHPADGRAAAVAIVIAEFLGQGSTAANGRPVRRHRLDPGLVRYPVRRTLDCVHSGRMMLKFWDLVSYFEDSALAANIRENDLLFPLIESVHVLSICLVVGSILFVDLRLLGLASVHRSVSRVTNGILALTWSAFAVALASGSLLFIS